MQPPAREVRDREGRAATDAGTLAAGAGFALLGRVSGQGLRVLTQIALARLLGPGPFGLYALGWTIFRISRIAGLLGLDKGVVRFGGARAEAGGASLHPVLRRSLLLALASGSGLGALLFFAAPRLASEGVFAMPGLSPVLRGFAVALPAVIVLGVAAAASRITQKTWYSVASEDLLQPVAQLSGVLLFLHLGWGLTGAVAAVVVSFALAAVVSCGWLVVLFPKTDSRPARAAPSMAEILRFSVPASLGAVFTMLLVWVDRIMVGYFRPAEEVGLYQAASQISLLFAMVLGAFAAVFAPLVVEILSRGEHRRLGELFRVSTKWGLYLTVPAFLIIVFQPRQVIWATFGPGYLAAWLPLVILAAGQLFNAATGSVGLLLIMSGHQRAWFLASGSALVVNVALNAALIPRWGLAGAAVASACSVVLLFGGGLLLARAVLRVWPYDARYLKLLAAAGVSALLLVGLRKVEISHPALSLAAHLAVGPGSFAGVLYAFPFDPEEEEVWGRVRGRLQRLRGGEGRR